MIKRYKVISGVILFLVGTFPICRGQSGEGLRVGATLGTSITYFSESARFEGGNPGLVVGGHLGYGFSDLLGASLEVVYHQQRGTRIDAPVTEPMATKVVQRNITLNALEIPIMAEVNLVTLNGNPVVFKPGYSFAYVMGAFSRDVNHFYFTDGNYLALRGSENVTSNYSQTQHAIIGSIGISFPLDSNLFKAFSFDVRYRKGLSNIEESGSVLNGRTTRVRTQSLQLVLAVSF